MGEMVKLGVVWLLFRKEFRKQFGALTEAIKSLEAAHNKRLLTLETDVIVIKKKIESADKV
jgi:hypothetical protein